jgi:hypothetical protein
VHLRPRWDDWSGVGSLGGLHWFPFSHPEHLGVNLCLGTPEPPNHHWSLVSLPRDLPQVRANGMEMSPGTTKPRAAGRLWASEVPGVLVLSARISQTHLQVRLPTVLGWRGGSAATLPLHASIITRPYQALGGSSAGLRPLPPGRTRVALDLQGLLS